MKILHIAAHLGAGAGKAIAGLILSDRSNQHSVVLLAEPKKTNHIERLEKRGINISCIWENDIQIAINDSDIVILNFWGHDSLYKFLREFPQIPCRIALWSHVNGVLGIPLPVSLLKSCDRFLSTSEFTLDYPHDVIYGFGDYDANIFPCKENYALTQADSFTIGFVGSPNYQKLAGDFVDYCLAVVERIPQARFVMAGEMSDDLMADIAASGMTNKFSFYGWVDNTTGLHAAFDVFGYPTAKNSFATTENVILEAMAAGVPTVLSSSPFGKYQLVDKESGFLFDTVQEYAEIMFNLYSDMDLREQIGKAGREYCKHKYSAERNVAAFDTAMRELMVEREKSIHSFVDCESEML
jgi:glycosyltransferase involved in cell wall biosynthesis